MKFTIRQLNVRSLILLLMRNKFDLMGIYKPITEIYENTMDGDIVKI